jgi:hypothetical protein
MIPKKTALFVALAFAATVSTMEARAVQSQSQPAQAKPEEKPAPPSLAGKWNVIVQSPNGNMDVGLDLKVDGKKIAGTIASQMGESKIEGELVDGKLKFWFTMDANGQTLNITFTGAEQKDGSLAGTLDFGQGEMAWTAVRAKN